MICNVDFDYYVLLTETELNDLVSAANREQFAGLRTFLYATQNYKGLRQLTFNPESHERTLPEFRIVENNTIIDSKNNIRGFRHVFPVPARPGEPQMAISHDWLWCEFSSFLNHQKCWAYNTDTELKVISRDNLNIEELWKDFWAIIASNPNLKQSLEMFLDNKTLFKKVAAAKAWGPEDIPILSKEMAEYLIHYYRYGKYRKKHFKQNSIDKTVQSLELIVAAGDYTTFPMIDSDSEAYVKGGDLFQDKKNVRCAGCGEVITKKKSLERKALFIKDADERAQSASDKDKLNHYCTRCVATVFLCPVKLAPETLTVRFFSMSNQRHVLSEKLVGDALKKFVAQSLHVHAGNYISLHISESIDKKPLCQSWGAAPYSLWKMAVTFPPELFAQGFGVEVCPGEEKFTLPRWALWFVSSLASLDNVFTYRCYSEKNLRTSFSQFLRLVSRKKIFQAFYMLISGDSSVLNQSYIYSWKADQLQKIWSEFETLLLMEDPMPLPDYPKIAGFVGLLLPLAKRVQSSKTNEDERKRAVGKLLEEVDRPIQYAYTAARESGSSDFIFSKRPDNRYFYEKAVELLGWAGENVERLRSEGESKAAQLVEKRSEFAWLKDAEETIFLSPDQIARVTGALVCENEKPYQNEADWRAFAYQVKLALWSMFPQYLGSKE